MRFLGRKMPILTIYYKRPSNKEEGQLIPEAPAQDHWVSVPILKSHPEQEFWLQTIFAPLPD